MECELPTSILEAPHFSYNSISSHMHLKWRHSVAYSFPGKATVKLTIVSV